jgi:hypothetical protein
VVHGNRRLGDGLLVDVRGIRVLLLAGAFIIGGCGSSASSQLAACSLLTPAEAGQVLGGSVVNVHGSGKYCTFTGPSPSSIVLIVQPDNLGIQGGNNAHPTVATTHVTVDGVGATYLPFVTLATESTPRPLPESGSLTFIHKGWTVNITVAKSTDPKSQTQQAMGYVLPSL